MLTIRLQRVGRKNDPSFRVIVVEAARAAKTGHYLELVGSYDPRQDRIDLKADRIKHWISMGATVSDTLHNILVSQKIIEGKKINVLPRKSPPKKEEAAAEAAAPAAEAPASEAKTEEPVSNDVAPEAAAQ
jgi:small subunit ribosomal protein S16